MRSSLLGVFIDTLRQQMPQRRAVLIGIKQETIKLSSDVYILASECVVRSVAIQLLIEANMMKV